jgi:hypothetical protein
MNKRIPAPKDGTNTPESRFGLFDQTKAALD